MASTADNFQLSTVSAKNAPRQMQETRIPKGISEIDVHQAADALVAQGERPTVERIRAHLGTGSLNTVTRWLETWWQHLSERLQAASPALTAGEPPATLIELAQQWWALAVSHAHTVAT